MLLNLLNLYKVIIGRLNEALKLYADEFGIVVLVLLDIGDYFKEN